MRVGSTYIGIEPRTEKGFMLVIKRGKVIKSDGRVIKSILKENSYEYLGILHSDQVLCATCDTYLHPRSLV